MTTTTLNRKTPPIIHNATEFNYILNSIEHSQLQNGIPLYYLSAGTPEVLSVEWVFMAGTWYETKAAVAQFTGGLLKNGTSTKTALQINELVEYYGASLKVMVGNDMTTVNLSCLSKHAHNLLPLIYELLTDSVFPETEVEIFKQRSLQRLQVSLQKSDFVANRKIDELLFGYAHPYGHYNNQADIEAVQSADLKAFLFDNFTSKNCKIFVSGKFPDSLITEIDQLFGKAHWNNAVRPPFKKAIVMPSTEKKHRITNDAKSVQGSIRMAIPFIEKSHPDFAKCIVLNTLFGGYFGSRLMGNIREDKGYTYGIYSYIYNNVNQGAFAISTECGKDVCEAAVAEVYKEMARIKTEPIAEEELLLVKNYLLGGLLGDLDGPFNIMQRWKNLILFGFQENRFYDNINIYKNITTKELQQLANTYFIEENFYDVVVW
jgi:zinc protease